MADTSFPSEGLTVFDWVARHAAARPSALALSGAGRRWTYVQLRDEAERLAQGLHRMGVRPGDTYGIVSDNHPATCLAWLAGARLGAIPSIVNSLLRERELGWILGNLEPRLVISDAAHLELVRASLAGRNVPLLLNEDAAADVPALDALMDADRYRGQLPQPGDPFEITYTSGTTANPKGVVLTHAAELFRADLQRELFGIGEGAAALAATPLFHQSGIRDIVLLMLRAGGHAAIVPKFSASGYWKQAIEIGATHGLLLDTMVGMMLRQPPTREERGHGIRRVMGSCSAALRLAAEERFGIRFTPGYGQTENGFPVNVGTSLSEEELGRYRDFAPRANFAGWPAEGNEVRVVDEAGRDVAEGEQGQIIVRSRGLLREYWRNPEATRASLVDGWMHTGDFGLRGPDGSLFFVDRMKDMMRRGGENIASIEVEGVLVAHHKVQTAAVFPVPDPLWNQEVKAILILKPGEQARPEELWEWCETRLARYKVPRYIEFRESLPMTGSGRVQKQQLRAEPIAGQGRTFDRTANASDSRSAANN